jgi:ribosomal 50S subunit-associated protein YjgA (DUF615 family)
MAETARSNRTRRPMPTCSRPEIQNKPQSLRARASLAQRLRALGPYALLEIVLPGGTLLAISLYMRTGAGPARRRTLAQLNRL